MVNPMDEKFARLLVRYSCDVKPGENVSLNIHSPATDLARALVREVFEAGAKPVLRMEYPEFEHDVLTFAPDSYFDTEPDVELNEIRQIQSWIRVRAPLNTRSLQNVDKSRYSRRLKRLRPVQDHRLDHTKWVGTMYPTDALAQDAGMSKDEYEKFLYDSMFLFDEDPVARWQEQENYQKKLVDRLAQAKEVRIEAEDTDLTLTTGGRTWVNSAGRHNMPCGEIFTGPVESSANGVITYKVPSSVNGVEVENIRLRFEEGKVVEAKAERGDDLLQSQLASDDGARYLGELGIGTNYRIQHPTKQILFDEKIGGTVHLALGSSYTDTGGLNKSAIHWDMVCDLRQGGAIYLDGELFQENGQFVI
ncbi:MAG TPA: aminopeptidase [Trueperaceae bacterium]